MTLVTLSLGKVSQYSATDKIMLDDAIMNEPIDFEGNLPFNRKKYLTTLKYSAAIFRSRNGFDILCNVGEFNGNVDP